MMRKLELLQLVTLIFGCFPSLVVGECENRYRALHKKHSMCPESRDISLKKEVMTDAIKREILDVHNGYRGKVNPPPKYMFKMIWDEEAAKVAMGWASQCGAGGAHDESMARMVPGRSGYGQNMASFSSGSGSWTKAIKMWYDEVEFFDYEQGGDISKTGHYTQVVWADSYRIGCGMATCESGDLYICNYGEAGNFRDKYGKKERPYFKSSTRGSDCGSNYDASSGLCDCGTSVCFNGGRLSPNTCKCDCSNSYTKKTIPWVVGPNCELDCSKGAKDDESQMRCQSYACQTSAIFQRCPVFCNLCSTSNGNYKNGVGKDPTSYISEAERIAAAQPGKGSGNGGNSGNSGDDKSNSNNGNSGSGSNSGNGGNSGSGSNSGNGGNSGSGGDGGRFGGRWPSSGDGGGWKGSRRRNRYGGNRANQRRW
ncbi:cysteine-rich venom protein-like isoform X2 [Tubulanus polymorphus]|uniref:cysteine-rich venom protein-like isoform X2 n=1 Tax=Tubulanus polymorphus TaxID=672921 RepID=UPI003DA3F789